jgi:uncharacterized Fe-S cluster-containing radical SAM superfamily protein
MVWQGNERVLAVAIDTDHYSDVLRQRAVDVQRRRLLVARLGGSEQEADLSEPVNCGGLGRVRHFRRETSPGWPANPLPIDPACAALGVDRADTIRAQVFQNAACNWRCWYCYVPFTLLAGSEKYGEWVEPAQLVDGYAAAQDRPPVIDMSGGQPDLVPEWTPWMMRALEERGCADSTYLWIDDNLSNDYFWRYLDDDDIGLVASWKMFGRVGCFKGFDAESFAFNTQAAPELFDRQFDLFARHFDLGVDCYGYVTFTGSDPSTVADAMARFVDRLQEIHDLLPLRTVPLEIALWGPVHKRMNADRERALDVQQRAIERWNAELESRFSGAQRDLPLDLVPMRARRDG